MPLISKNKTIRIHTTMGHQVEKYDVYCNADGMFYTRLDLDIYMDIVQGIGLTNYQVKGDKVLIFFDTSSELESKMYDIVKVLVDPETVEELVICYNVDAVASFGMTPDGDVTPNPEGEDYVWHKYGEQHATNPADGGFSVTIGARVYVKCTHTMGDRETVNYESAYSRKELGEYGKLLSRWCSFSLPKDAPEMPYTEDNAKFFHEMMVGIVTIAKMLKDRTETKEQIITMIASNQKLLGQ